jgi:hypothetical protein
MKKQIGIGFIVGLIANLVGIIICLLVVSFIKGSTLVNTFNLYVETGSFWTVLTLGALPNLAVFFSFLKVNREYRARGVVIATFTAAITAYIIYLN